MNKLLQIKGLQIILSFSIVMTVCISDAFPQNVNIPDPIFKGYLLGHTGINTNSDGEIQVSEAAAFAGSIDVSNLGIMDLTGIEAFTSLTELNCSNNLLTALDVSSNMALTILNCSYNQLTALNVSSNTGLTILHCYNNQLTGLNVLDNSALFDLRCSYNALTNLDVSANEDLEILLCGGNPLPSLDVSNNPALIQLFCIENQLTSLDVSNNPALGFLSCGQNQLTSLDLSSNEALTELYFDFNQLTSLDVSNNPALKFLDCGQNQLTSLDVSNNSAMERLSCDQNQLTSLDLSSNTALTFLDCQSNQLETLNVKNGNYNNFTIFRAQNNPDLECIQVDDAAYSQSNWANKDAGASFSVDCSPVWCTVDIPDVAFKNYLIDNFDINTNEDDEIQCLEAAAFNGTLNVNGLGISDLTGIEAFTAITALSCSNNQLTTLNVSSNTALQNLFCLNNQLTSLDVSNNMALTDLRCVLNQLTSLDISGNPAITTLFCQDNQLETLNVKNGNNTSLTTFNATGNPQLLCIQVDDEAASHSSWDVDAEVIFSEDCTAALCIIDIPDAIFKNYLVLNTLINTTGDNEIQCFEAAAFTGIIDVSNLGIEDLAGIEAFTGITALYCSNNQLNTLNVSSNIALQTLFCEINQLTSLDVSSNTELSYLRCSGNQLTALDVSDNTLLTSLYCLNNQITSLDLSANSNLTTLNCSNNLLTSLNVKNGNNPNMTTFVAVDNPELSCIRVDDVSYSETFWTNIDPGVEFSVDCPPPAASFTSASNVCLGNSVQFSNTTTGTASSWLWEFGDGKTSTAQNPSHTYSSSSSYMVTLTATNANGSDEATKTIAVNSQPVVSLGIDVTQCGGTFTLDAGNPGSAYQWSTVATTQSITVSESGTYSVTVTGVSGCTDTDEINVTIHPEPVVSLGDDITQCGGTVTLDAGNPDFSYLWSTGATTQSITVSESENYSLTVTGTNGCTTSDQVNVMIHPSLSGTLEWSDESSCGEGDGSAAITPSGGTAPYTFAWSNSGSTSSINDLTAGEYTVTITDSKGCTFTDMAVIGCVVGFEPLEDSMFEVYPNPNTGLFEISLLIPVKDHVTVHVNNPLGQLVFNEELHEFSGEYGKALDLQSLGKGVYSVRVKTSKGSVFRKVMVY